MSDKKHIDRLFQEKLKDFEVTPKNAVWDTIHDRLHKDKRKRRVIPLWWKLAGVAAVVALLLTVGIQLLPNDTNSSAPNSVVDTEIQSSDTKDASNSNSNISDGYINQTDNSSTIANEDGSIQDEISRNPSTETSNGNQNNYNVSDAGQNRVVNNSDKNGKENNGSKITNGNSKIVQNNNLGSSKDAVVTTDNANQKNLSNKDDNREKEASDLNRLINDSKNDVNSAVTDNPSDKDDVISQESIKEALTEEKTIEDAIAEANTKDEKEKKLNRWSISPNVAPVYFNSLGKGSTLDEQFVDNANSSEVTVSYGVGGSYAINEKLKVRAGINKVNMGYSTNNVIAFRNIEASNFATSNTERTHLTNVDMNSSSENMIFLSTVSFNRSITPEIINSKSSGSINQRFGFIEVPLEMEYAVINTKFGVNVIGGFSTFIVDENEIYSVVNGTETNIGEANNINNMSYSANFGLGINYNISDKIKVNLEPTFKYQINTFSNSSGDFQPFFIGVYTGLSYKF